MTALRPMTEAEYAGWLERKIPAYAADKVASGQWTEAESLEKSRREYAELLPEGPATPENHLHSIVDDDGRVVGALWFAMKRKFDARIAYVFDVEIDADQRRRGHALRAFEALDREAVALGLTGVALHVFGHNTEARALYERLGYEPTNISLYKPLPAAAEAG